MLRTMHWTGLLMVASLLTGCAHMQDVTDDCVMKWSCHHEAKMAWHSCRHLYADVACPFDFGKGFRAGYRDICMGRDGCAPPMPPRHYWSHRYQCDEGRCQIMAWYDGYHHGVLAAQCDGWEGNNQVLCAGDLYGHSHQAPADYSDLEHRVVPESEMPGGPYDDGTRYGPGMDMNYEAPLETPPAPAASGQPVPLSSPGVTSYDEGTEVGPTPAPELRQMLAPGATTGAPSF